MNEHKDRDWLYQKYVIEKKSTMELGRLSGCTFPTITRFLKKYGIPIRSRKESAQIRCDAISADYKSKAWLSEKYSNDGMGILAISKLCNVSKPVIDYWLKKHGIARRSRKGLGHKLWERPEYRSNQLTVRRMLASNPEQHEFLRSISTRHWGEMTGQERRAFIDSRHHKCTPEQKEKMRLVMTGRRHTEIHRQHNSESQKKLCKDNPERMLALTLAASTKRPTLPEQLLDQLTPPIVRYVGNRQWWRKLGDGKFHNPDFKVTGRNKVIEVYGDYWHRSDDPQTIIDLYKKSGLDCLVFWESEIKNSPDFVKETIDHFLSL